MGSHLAEHLLMGPAHVTPELRELQNSIPLQLSTRQWQHDDFIFIRIVSTATQHENGWCTDEIPPNSALLRDEAYERGKNPLIKSNASLQTARHALICHQEAYFVISCRDIVGGDSLGPGDSGLPLFTPHGDLFGLLAGCVSGSKDTLIFINLPYVLASLDNLSADMGNRFLSNPQQLVHHSSSLVCGFGADLLPQVSRGQELFAALFTIQFFLHDDVVEFWTSASKSILPSSDQLASKFNIFEDAKDNPQKLNAAAVFGFCITAHHHVSETILQLEQLECRWTDELESAQAKHKSLHCQAAKKGRVSLENRLEKSLSHMKIERKNIISFEARVQTLRDSLVNYQNEKSKMEPLKSEREQAVKKTEDELLVEEAKYSNIRTERLEGWIAAGAELNRH